MSESFYDAKPVDRAKRVGTKQDAVDPTAPLDDSLTLFQVQKLLFYVQEEQEQAVREMGSLIDDLIEAETEWKAHEARTLMLIRDRIARQGDEKNKEKSSTDLREAEVLNSTNEEGKLGKTLYRSYRLMEERVRLADRRCRMLEKRGGLLQTLSANLRDIT